MTYVRQSHRVTFPGHHGLPLAGIIDGPENPFAVALLTHCFTCNKDLKAIVRISRRLADLGVRVLRYDWAGLGQSSGRFAETTFSTGLEDLRCAMRFLASPDSGMAGRGPDFLIGYSLGGAASLAAASELPNLRGVATLGSPDDTSHLADLLERMDPQIAAVGLGEVEIGGRRWEIRRPLVEDLRDFDLESRLGKIRQPVMIVHSTDDETVPYSRALALQEKLTRHEPAAPVSLMTLSGADHLLTNDPRDWEWVSQSLASWMHRFASRS